MAKATKEPASNTLHAFDFLKSKSVPLPRGVCVLFGNQRFLKLQVLKSIQQTNRDDDNDNFSTTRFDEKVEWPILMDELKSQSLFSNGDKCVILDNADDFVKKQREKLEDVAQDKGVVGTLVLVVDSWLASTRLYKIVDKQGLQIDCSLPQVKRGKSSSVDSGKLNQWLIDFAQSVHQVSLSLPAVKLLCDFTDSDLGRIDSELAKLSLYVKPGESITEVHVKQHVGGWRTQTMWEASDAVAGGRTKEALVLLDRLLKSGEHPLALFGQLSWALRRYPKVVEIYDRMKETNPRPSVREAAAKAGFREWGDDITNAEQNLKRLGRAKAEMLGTRLLQTDLALKGTHSRDERARLILELLAAGLAETPKK
jgi:DNA polymerase III subunit delta